MELNNPLFWLIALISIPLAFVAIRIGLTFDLTKYLENRREHQKEKLRILCPHAQIVEENGEPLVVPTYVSPSGTHKWICERCGTEAFGPGPFDRAMETYRKNPMLLLRDEKRVQKYAKKFYKL